MSEKTLQVKDLNYFKDQVAKNYECINWDSLEEWVQNSASLRIDGFIEEAAERYATYMCKEQKKLCAEHAMILMNPNRGDYKNSRTDTYSFTDRNGIVHKLAVSKKSILNAPLATHKNK